MIIEESNKETTTVSDSTQAHMNASAMSFNLYEAVAAYELYWPTRKNEAMFEYINKGGLSGGFMFVRSSIYRGLLLSLGRVWDFDSRTDSMQRLLKRLSDKNVIEVYGHTWDEGSVDRLREQCATIVQSDPCKAVRGARNKFVAHTEARFLVNAKPVVALEPGYELQLIDLTYPLVHEAAGMVGCGVMPREEYTRSWREHATRFWRQTWPAFRSESETLDPI